MVSRVLRELAGRYREALAAYLQGAEESALLAAYEAGREALEDGLDLLDLSALHGQAVASLIESGPPVRAATVARRAGQFFAEALAPYEMVHRGYREANATLRHLSETLEEQVARRTRELEESLSTLRQLHEQRRQLLKHLVTAQEEERRRIAEDIHDDPIQAITAVGMRLELVQRRLRDRHSAEELRALGEVVQLAIGRLRHLVFALRPPALDREGLVAALRQHLEEVRGHFGLPFRLEARLPTEPRAEVRTVLYRIVQEALSNVRRHARASLVEVEVEARDGGVWVRVRDDGVGFPVGEVPESAPGHLGLSSMRERAELVGGWCRIASQPGKGTTVELWVPSGTSPPSAHVPGP